MSSKETTVSVEIKGIGVKFTNRILRAISDIYECNDDVESYSITVDEQDETASRGDDEQACWFTITKEQYELDIKQAKEYGKKALAKQLSDAFKPIFRPMAGDL